MNRAMAKLFTHTWMIIIRSVVSACSQSIAGRWDKLALGYRSSTDNLFL